MRNSSWEFIACHRLSHDEFQGTKLRHCQRMRYPGETDRAGNVSNRWRAQMARSIMKVMRFTGILLGALLCAASSPAEQKKSQKKPEDSTSIKVAVEMVSLPVVVTTRDGKRVTDLAKKDFQVVEDGVPQEIA